MPDLMALLSDNMFGNFFFIEGKPHSKYKSFERVLSR